MDLKLLRLESPRHPTMGQLHLKGIKMESAKKMDFTPTLRDKSNISHKAELYMAGDVALMPYKKMDDKTPVHTLENSPARYRIRVGVSKPLQVIKMSSFLLLRGMS